MQEISWRELADRGFARQFPAADSIDDLLRQVGPIQAQAARAPFLGIAARLPGTDRAAISEAYESLRIVRGSNIRGTVHTSTPDHSVLLDALTRIGQRVLWQRILKPQRVTLEEIWSELERYAYDEWRTPEGLREHLQQWLEEHDGPGSGGQLDNQAGRYFAFGHGGLLRRPLTLSWDGQGAPGYRTAAALLGDRSAAYADPEETMRSAVRLHITCHGPASRQDIAWWAGVGLTKVDAAIEQLAGDLSPYAGPDGRMYYDLPGMPEPVTPPTGVLLLPEFDALLCGYEPSARTRFIDPDHHRLLWHSANGLVLPPMLVDGRITGYWRLSGSGAKRDLTAYYFRGTRRPTVSEIRSAAESVSRALGFQITAVKVLLHR